MTHIVTTPLDAPFTRLAPRAGQVDPALLDAVASDRATAERLLLPGALCVTTGQQPGLLTGPLYTVHKALAAVALAGELERACGRPVVPVFWMAGDDHDFAEGARAAWLTEEAAVRHAVLRERPAAAPLIPLARERVGPEGDAVLAQLEQDVGAMPFGEDTVRWLRRHYRPDATLAGAAIGALVELLAPYGLVCLDASHVALKRVAAPTLRRALTEAAPLDLALAGASATLAAGGRDPGVVVGDGATLVMLEAERGRDRLVTDGDGFITRRSRERFSAGALDALLDAEPQRFSANVLLRPVVESAILPTVAYLAGPGELRYFPLTRPVAARLGVPAQAALPRWSGLVVDDRVERITGQLGIAPVELLGDVRPLEARFARESLPPAVLGAYTTMRAALRDGFATLQREAPEIDPVLERTVQGAEQRARIALDALEEKLIRHQKRRAGTRLGQLVRVRNAIAPDGRPQERVLTVASLLARHGPGLLDELLGTMRAWYAERLEAPVGAA